MIVYWSYFLATTIAVLSPIGAIGRVRWSLWGLLLFFAVIFIGLRHQVGGDWDNYIVLLNRVDEEGLYFALTNRDPGYLILNWVAARMGWGIYGTNVICAIIFIAGLFRFCLRQPLPRLAWLVAIPYMTIVVSMGYTRQGVALGMFMWALTLLEDRKGWSYCGVIILASIFHTSIILTLPLLCSLVTIETVKHFQRKIISNTASTKSLVNILVVAGILVVLGIANFSLFQSQLKAYVHGEFWQSEGGFIRACMNGVPAVALIVWNRRWRNHFGGSTHWYLIACIAIIMLPAVFFYSTVVDRLGIYLLPLQLYFFSRLPLLVSDNALRSWIMFGICLYYALVMWVWLNFAEHAYYWTQYHSLLIL